ncbi:hypothetical protein PENTCL1PPCAC_30872, partial [Pristionchus entomophagus]
VNDASERTSSSTSEHQQLVEDGAHSILEDASEPVRILRHELVDVVFGHSTGSIHLLVEIENLLPSLLCRVEREEE